MREAEFVGCDELIEFANSITFGDEQGREPYASKQGGISPAVLLPETQLIGLDIVVASPNSLTLIVSTIQPAAPGPACGQPAARVPSGYVGAPADLPCGGLPVRLELPKRRFYGDVPDCPRRIFTERLPGLVLPYSRRTARLTGALEAIADALGGAAGARLAPRWAWAPARRRYCASWESACRRRSRPRGYGAWTTGIKHPLRSGRARCECRTPPELS